MFLRTAAVRCRCFLSTLFLLVGAGSALASGPYFPEQTDRDLLEPIDVFELEFASDPQIAPDGAAVVYVRNFMDVMSDAPRSNLWIASTDGNDHRPLTTGDENDRAPRWSPDGQRLAYVSGREGGSQIWMRWMDSGQAAKLTHLESAPSGLSFSPDGRWIAFVAFVREPGEPFAAMPRRPEGAQWAEAPRVIEKLRYRADGAGYLEDGYRQIFVLSAEGGTPRQVTEGAFQHGAPAWTPDNKLVFSANRKEDWEYDANDTDVFELDPAGGELRRLSDRHGPDQAPLVSPDGRFVAYTGNEERYLGSQNARVSVLERSSGDTHEIHTELDRSLGGLRWAADSSSLYVQYDDQGNTRVGRLPLDGRLEPLVDQVGGTSLGRPYGGGSYTVARDGTIAYTLGLPSRPADVAVLRPGGQPRVLTQLNEDLLAGKTLGVVEELWATSNHDGRKVHGWIVKPPGFDPGKKYPLVLEIHGGPFSNYGPRFAAEIQLYAAAGNVVLYTNPRGSTSYGEEFANLIHHAYPGNDYDDLISSVDAMIAKGYIDERRLFVTGGSGGGVLTSWIVGHTDRFRAAVVQKPVINWYSFVLTADSYPTFVRYWFPDYPWNEPQHYLDRSPISYVGNVTTPTMLITGEVDYRTPISESEQYYQALKLLKVPTALVRIPGASHGIAARPSQLIAKVVHVLEWFDRHGGAAAAGEPSPTAGN